MDTKKRRPSGPRTFINFTLKPETKEYLELLAEKDGRTVSNYCRVLIAREIEVYKNELDKTHNSSSE